MKTITLAFGAFHILCFIAGSIGLIDYHVCIKAAGQCSLQTGETK